MKDPIVEEIRGYRMEHTQRFNGDLAAICADLRRVQASCGHAVVRLLPRLIPIRQPQDGRVADLAAPCGHRSVLS